MLPVPDHSPPRCREHLGRLLVTLPVASDLRRPEIRSSLRNGEVLRAAVPEASIDEHGNPLTRERNVHRPATGSRDLEIHAVAVPSRMQRVSKRQFGQCVSAPLGLHPAPDGWLHVSVHVRKDTARPP